MSAQFRIDYHAELTILACPDDATIKDQLPRIVAANVATDLNQTESALHFDNCDFDGGVQRILQLWKFIGSGQDENPYVSFGGLTHTVQDFYAHSNWIELHLDDSPVPVWDLTVSSLPPGTVSGTYSDNPKCCPPGTPTHAELNKDQPDSPEGSKVVTGGPNQGKSYFDLAFATALAATKVQYAELQAVLGV